MTKLLKGINSKGDTIIEVLIAIAVVSLVLAGAYVSSNRSTQATRTAQERGEALKLAESQAEQIRLAAVNKTPDIFAAGNFCLSGASLLASCTSGTGLVYTTLVAHVPTSTDFIIKVTWPGLSGVTNNVELDMRVQ